MITEDVSASGMFLRTNEEIPLRQLVKLRVPMPSGDSDRGTSSEVCAVVVHQSAGRGIGVQIFGVDALGMRRWRGWIGRAWDATVRYRPLGIAALLRALEDRAIVTSYDGRLQPKAVVSLETIHPETSRSLVLEARVEATLSQGETPGVSLVRLALEDPEWRALERFVDEEIPIALD